jgi:hypothetical protein
MIGARLLGEQANSACVVAIARAFCLDLVCVRFQFCEAAHT